jgi:hypothetical protein
LAFRLSRPLWFIWSTTRGYGGVIISRCILIVRFFLFTLSQVQRAA